MKPKTEYRSCRLCCGSRVNPDGPGMCPRCDGTARDPEGIHHGDITRMAEDAAAEFRSTYTAFDLGRVVIPMRRGDPADPQRGQQITPSNDIDPRADLKRGVRLVVVTAVVCYLLGMLTGLLAGCTPPPQNTPPIGGSPRDSVRVTAEREHAMFAAQEQAAQYGWQLVSASQFARIAVWYKADPFWTIGLGITQPGADQPDTVQVFDQRITVNGKSYTIHREIQPGATLSYTWTDGEGWNQARTYHAILCNIQPGDLYFAKYHHAEDWLRVEPLDMRRVRR